MASFGLFVYAQLSFFIHFRTLLTLQFEWSMLLNLIRKRLL